MWQLLQIQSTLEEGIYLYDCENVTVINCSFRNNRSGVVALFGSGIQILHCQFQNPGDFDKKVAGQFVQFDKVTGAQNKINNNVGEAILGKSYPEDLISIYKSFGDGNNPIEIKGNRLRGGGPSNSGGGIMTGDLEGGNIIVEDNILVNPGQYGIAIASGKNIRILNNKVYGKKQSFTNVGIYVWNQSKAGCSDNEVRGNFVNFTDSRGNANSHWDGGNCGAIEGWDYNDWNSKINESILPAQLLCTDKKNE